MIFGPDARTQIESLQTDFGGPFIDFNSFSPGTLTRFFNAANQLLAPDHFNTQGSEFVAFIADTNDTSTWISRIQIDSDSTRQVGYSDDLFFGTQIPEPSASFLILIGLSAAAFRLLKKKKSSAEFFT